VGRRSVEMIRLKLFGPPAGVVINAQDLERVMVHPVGDDKRSFGDDEFPRAGTRPG
jgi:hypothetical protein